jgi:hypothetical protein
MPRGTGVNTSIKPRFPGLNYLAQQSLGALSSLNPLSICLNNGLALDNFNRSFPYSINDPVGIIDSAAPPAGKIAL